MTGCLGALLILAGVRLFFDWVEAFLAWDGAPAVLLGVIILFHVFLIWNFIRICKQAIRAENLRSAGLPVEDLTDDEKFLNDVTEGILLSEGLLVLLFIGWRLGFIGS